MVLPENFNKNFQFSQLIFWKENMKRYGEKESNYFSIVVYWKRNKEHVDYIGMNVSFNLMYKITAIFLLNEKFSNDIALQNIYFSYLYLVRHFDIKV